MVEYPLEASDLTNVAIGLPPLVTAAVGFLVVFYLIWNIKQSPGIPSHSLTYYLHPLAPLAAASWRSCIG
jgi:hypothetical protein